MSCDCDEEFQIAQDAIRRLDKRLSMSRLRQVATSVRQHKKQSSAPRHTQYKGHNATTGKGLVRSLGSNPIFALPISNGWLKPGDVVEFGSGKFDFNPRIKTPKLEEPAQSQACTPKTIHKFISQKGTTQHLPFKFLQSYNMPANQLRRIKTRWRLVEVGSLGTDGNDGLLYASGYLKGGVFMGGAAGRNEFNLENSSFTSPYDYPGYMQLQIGCYDSTKDEVKWKI